MISENESGRSMVEMLGVLSIMGVIMYGAVAGINYGIDMYNINATHTEVEELAQAVMDLFSWTQNYSGLSNNSSAILCDNDAFASCRNGQMTNKWGASVTVTPVQEDGSACAGENCTAFTITYQDVPYLACERLLHDLDFVNACPYQPAECAREGHNQVVFLSSYGSCL